MSTPIRGAHLEYEVLGDRGPWVALSPGGRRPGEELRSLGERFASAGCRVLLHDRRNCGGSDVLLDASEPEHQVWADDLVELLSHLGVDRAWIGGGSSGARLSMTVALRHPELVQGLLLWRVTGGEFATRRLARQYYGQYAEVAREGGMQAVCATEHFAGLIARRPENQQRLRSIDADDFIVVMERWYQGYMDDIGNPVLGFTEGDLAAITAPTCIVPGNDNTHSLAIGELAQGLLPDATLHVLYPEHQDVDMVPPAEWAPKERELAQVLLDHMASTGDPAASG